MGALTTSKKRLAIIWSLLLLTVAVDQLTKYAVRTNLHSPGSFHYLYNCVVLEHAENSGAFLSLGSSLGNTTRFWIFTISVAVFLAGALIFLIQKRAMSRWNTIAVTFLIAGGLGNLIDRITRGTVTDFINLGIGPVRTGIFNIADVAIVAGVAILMFFSFKSPAHQKKEADK
jgi:signal peptidase II